MIVQSQKQISAIKEEQGHIVSKNSTSIKDGVLSLLDLEWPEIKGDE